MEQTLHQFAEITTFMVLGFMAGIAILVAAGSFYSASRKGRGW